MSMQEPTDDQLDGLFRKSAEEFDVPFDPASWQVLKNRLDTHDRFTLWEHLLRWGIPVLLLLLLTGGSWNAYLKQRNDGQSANTSIAHGQLAPANRVPGVKQPTQPRRQLGDSQANAALSESSEEIAKAEDSAPPATTEPVGPESSEAAVAADTKNPGAAEATKPAATDIESRPASAGVVNRVNSPDRTAPLAGKVAQTVTAPVRSPLAMESSVKTTAGRNKPVGFTGAGKPETIRNTLKTAPVASRSLRVRSGTGRNRQSRQGALRTPETTVAATSRVTSDAETAVQSGRKRNLTSSETPGSGAQPTSSDLAPQPASMASEPAVAPSFAELTNRPALWPKPLPFAARALELPVVTPAEPEQRVSAQPVPSQKGLSIRFMVSPDLSGIGLRDLQRPGTNIGLMLDYRLASRWSIQTGVLRSTKVYKALPSEYEWPSIWTSPVRPLSVDGRCNMFDIPINLRYDLVIRPRSDGRLPDRWFISAGATSYYIKQEDYDYTYKAHTYNVPTSWHGSTGWNGFSQLNLSGGFERSFSRRLSWQVEPFLKVPLKGVGFFKIDLMSTGAFFSIRYKL